MGEKGEWEKGRGVECVKDIPSGDQEKISGRLKGDDLNG